MKKGYHYILLGLTVVIALACGWLVPRVNVNSDMTKYLPNQSRMRQGLEIIMSDFSAAQLQSADVKAMFPDVRPDERDVLMAQLNAIQDVNGVTYNVSADSAYTLFNLVVPKSIDQKALGKAIRERYGDDVIVETSQDGATPPFSVIVIAAILIFTVLFLMAQSWLDPLLILISTGIAVVINVGTNYFMPSVSITTNYIAPILQLVLSLDYSIVLLNRYRQELNSGVERTLSQSINTAIQKATPSIISSALTTVVGLLMLLLMRLKIGMDMGIVLAKGVLCSLICTFTVLPSLLLLCHNWLQKTNKRVFVLPTDRISRFVTHHKVTLVIFIVLLFGSSYYFSRQTEITFSTNGESKISKVFPRLNPMLVIYDTKDEPGIMQLADSMKQSENVLSIVSYPTLLKEQYTATELTAHIKRLTTDMADYMPTIDNMSMLTPELMQVVYYLHSGSGDTLAISFPEVMRFIKEECIENPLFANVIDERMRSQIQLLDGLLAIQGNSDDEEEEEEEVIESRKSKVESQKVLASTPGIVESGESREESGETRGKSHQRQDVDAHLTLVSDESQKTKVESGSRKHNRGKMAVDGKVSVIQFANILDAIYANEQSRYLRMITDTTQLRKDMNVRQMADYIGSTNSQTKLIFSMSDYGKRMTPLQYVHFLTDDLFQRKALRNMVSDEQKNELIIRERFMDNANIDAYLSIQELSSMLIEYGFHTMSEARVLAIAQGQDLLPEQEETIDEEFEHPLYAESDSCEQLEQELRSTEKTTSPIVKSDTERKAELMVELMGSDKRYKSTEMVKIFKSLGETIAPSTVNLLYCYYGSQHNYNDSLRMSLEGLLYYAADTLIQDQQVTAFLDEPTRQLIESIPEQLKDGIGMLSHEDYALMVLVTDLPDESDETYAFVERLDTLSAKTLNEPCYLVGESVMFDEMKRGFSAEMTRITLFTILAIFLIVALTFKSVLVPTILVMTVMTAVFVNVTVSGWVSGGMLYLAYLIVQSILMGATIDYGILFANYYKENRRTLDEYDSSTQAYKGSIRTIMTSGIIMVIGPGVMAVSVNDVAISSIVGCLAVGSAVSVLLILFVLPGILVAFDRWVVNKKKCK
ncbi:MAG: MMPL family transporter [Paludibacteraceae bacterium]|nr:MMPL family transporter [Paludibacteraceae bacterium]